MNRKVEQFPAQNRPPAKPTSLQVELERYRCPNIFPSAYSFTSKPRQQSTFFFSSKTFKQNCIALFYFYLREGAPNTSRVCAINGGTSLYKIGWGCRPTWIYTFLKVFGGRANWANLGVQGTLTHLKKIKIYKKLSRI